MSAERREFGFVYKRGRLYWIRYRIGGKEHRESTGSTSLRTAGRLLVQRQTEYGHGLLTEPQERKLTFESLIDGLRVHYRESQNRSAARMERAVGHLAGTFAGKRALSITAGQVAAYRATRREEGASPSTVNYECAMLRAAFRLAVKRNELKAAPYIPTPAVDNARAGFLEADDFEAIRRELRPVLQDVFTFAYWSGWRTRAEILTLTWDRVDWAAGTVTLLAQHAKSKKARALPFAIVPDLAAVLQRRLEETRALEAETGQIVRLVFHHRGGKPIKDYYTAWRGAVRRASAGTSRGTLTLAERPHLASLIPHDLRRTAARNLVRAGVSETVAMTITGHTTRSIFQRYNITDDHDQRDALTKLAAHLGHAGAKGTPGAHSTRRRLGGER